MYLAPLNYDRFFKKVFSDKKIAKAFIEDFLDIKIEDIEVLPAKYQITDEASLVEFDYRCKIKNGEYIIIEMQQWYKSDIARRFYLYHTLSTAIQLENIPKKIIALDRKNKKTIREKDYSKITPVITLIWMVDDNLKFQDDFIVYKMTPEELINFVKNENLWESDLDKIVQERKRVIKLDENKQKGLDFISQNKLIFMFQKNIVKNHTHPKSEKHLSNSPLHSSASHKEGNIKLKKKINYDDKLDKYVRWFDFAKKTKNKKNKKEDFEKFKKDKIFIDIMNRLVKKKLTDDEIKYISDEEQFIVDHEEYKAQFTKKLEEAQEKEKEAQKKEKEAQRKEKEAQRKEKEAQKKIQNTVLRFYKKGFTIEELSKDFDLSINDVEKIIGDN